MHNRRNCYVRKRESDMVTGCATAAGAAVIHDCTFVPVQCNLKSITALRGVVCSLFSECAIFEFVRVPTDTDFAYTCLRNIKELPLLFFTPVCLRRSYSYLTYNFKIVQMGPCKSILKQIFSIDSIIITYRKPAFRCAHHTHSIEFRTS